MRAIKKNTHVLLRLVKRGMEGAAWHTEWILRHLRTVWKTRAYAAFSWANSVYWSMVRPMRKNSRFYLDVQESSNFIYSHCFYRLYFNSGIEVKFLKLNPSPRV